MLPLMAPSTVYLETTVLSYLTARDARDGIIAAHQSVTRTWWESHRQQYRVGGVRDRGARSQRR
jgi:hypothetical protein